MRILGLLGVALVAFGVVVLAVGGVGYLKGRDTSRVSFVSPGSVGSDTAQSGSVALTTERRGTITPAAGFVAVAVGLVLMVAGSTESGGRRATHRNRATNR